MFRRILIANRGEIAVRIIRTCREMGIETHAVYTEVDRLAMHVRLADQAWCLGGPGGYMDADAIIGVAQAAGADAVHPGYGFLSENPAFASLCAANGLTFIGPHSSTIELMGHKTAAREAVRRAGVPVVPGSEGAIDSDSEALAEARRIGFPIMIKAVAGGGGRGMRPAPDEDSFLPAFAQAVSEARATSGNPKIYLEKYMHNFKHIEIQIMADEHGNSVYLGERDCSIQRRNQKLLEEAPSKHVSPSLRQEMGRAALQVVKAANYTNVGTIEFIVDQDGRYYFMEMNTRIQVEHAVTEMVTGLDLVREQIRLAAGLPLDVRQEDIVVNGWAMECRINAENSGTFLPCPGQVQVYQPPGGYGVRVDSALYPGYAVPPHYDALVAKLLVWGRNRDEAMERMDRALTEFRIEGIDTTIPFHLRLLNNERFRAGEYNTDFVHRHMNQEDPKGVGEAPPVDSLLVAAIGAALSACLEKERSSRCVTYLPSRRQSLWRAGALNDLMRQYY